MNPIDGDRFWLFLKDQKVKETGAFSKGLNKGLNIAISALKNKEITLPWEVDRVRHGRWEWRGGIPWCSNCGEMPPGYSYEGDANTTPYCPKCGAKMDKKES